ncbi:MAG: transposase [Thermoleophilia bacterium]|nr:transposase [Thermoleophilia bacterium]
MARLKADWHTQYEAWSHRPLGDRKPVYLWADGIYVKAGLDKEKAALLVVICAHADGRKEVLALTPRLSGVPRELGRGVPGSAGSWSHPAPLGARRRQHRGVGGGR